MYTWIFDHATNSTLLIIRNLGALKKKNKNLYIQIWLNINYDVNVEHMYWGIY